MATQTERKAFVDSVIEEIVKPGLQQLMDSRYFTDLRAGKLSVRQLQGFALQHYLHNHAVNRGFSLCMVKYAHMEDVYEEFLYQLMEEQSHPALAKRFGLALGLTDEDFRDAIPIFECRAHTGLAMRGMLLGNVAENRTAALVNESMVQRYSEEFDVFLRKNYDIPEEALEFFVVHRVADQEHTARAAALIARFAETDHDRLVVRETARQVILFKLGKFDGIHREYA